MKGRIRQILAAELEFCERERKRWYDLGYTDEKITKDRSLAYWKGRIDACQEIRSKIEKELKKGDG